MKAQIRDKQALSSISIEGLTSYLQTHKWINKGKWGNRPAIVYTKKRAGRHWDILVPTHTDVADYIRGMAEALEILATIEDRSQLDIFNDLKVAAFFDVIRLRSINGIAQKPISLRRKADLLEDAYGMVAAAARAVESQRAAYRGSPSAEVAEYLDNVRLLPEYDEGYSLALYSHASADIDNKQDSRGNEHNVPFARRAMAKLAQALERAEAAISESAANDAISPFKDAVDYGVSANLCASVANIAQKGKGVEIGIQWAANYPANVPNAKFRFTEDSADILNEVAKFFRVYEPSYGESLRVIRMEREPDESDGRADLLAWRDSRLERVKVEFDKVAYAKVTQALKERKEISLNGDVHRVGDGYELRNPRNLSIIGQEMQPR